MRGYDRKDKIRGRLVLVRERAVSQELARYPLLHKILLGRGGGKKVTPLVYAIA